MTITGYDGFGAPIWDHALTQYECGSCSTRYASERAANECCGRWDGRGWD